MTTFSDSYLSNVLMAIPTPKRGLDVATRRWRWLRTSLFDPYQPRSTHIVIDRGYENRPVLKIVANPAPYGDTKHGDRYQISPRQLVKKIAFRNKFDAMKPPRREMRLLQSVIGASWA
jgi:hypothetical protein